MQTGTHTDVRNALLALERPERASFAARFFQVKPGHYGEGDEFLGLSMPQQHAVAKQYLHLPLDETEQLVRDPYHECRMTGLLIWVYQSRSGMTRFGGVHKMGSIRALPNRSAIVERYLANRRYVNNWDLVDSSCTAIVGEYLLD